MNTTASVLNHVIQARKEHFDFNFEFLIFTAVGVVLTVFFLLYFNRLFASGVSYAIRTWTWHRYRVYIDVRAIQISLLGGRVFFTGLRYHGANETFMIQHGYITWRYWLRRVREADIVDARNLATIPHAEDAAVSRDKNAQLPCRIHVDLTGLEWFVYNRSPAYDTVVDGLAATGSDSHSSGVFEKDRANLKSRGSRATGGFHEEFSEKAKEQGLSQEPNWEHPGRYSYRRTTTGFASDDDRFSSASISDLPLMLQFFPIQVECQKAAMVVGNENTKAILIAKADSLSALVDASETTTPDPYRQVFKVKLDKPVIEMRENEDFKEDQASRATREREAGDSQEMNKRSFFRHHRRKALSSLRNLVPYWRRSVESFSSDSRTAINTAASQIPGNSQWQGLTRYLDDRDQDDRARWASVEYAALSTVLDSPEATLTVYWDSVGTVREQPSVRRDLSVPININGEEPPAWGMNLSVKGGTMNYGPWADRQRADLQRYFFPGLCKDAVPAQSLNPGTWRVATQFKLYVELDDAVTLRLPIREESKNWRWRGKEPQMKHKKLPTKRKQRARAKKNSKGEAVPLRPAGWLEVKVPSNSTVSFNMDMIASPAGYKTSVNIDLPSTELWSSVNHDLLWRSGPQRILCDLSNPLSWNGLRNWHFNISSNDLELFLLRDHVFLLIDLIDDWTSGPPPEYLVFTPFKYHINLTLQSLKLYLNVNDANIIDKATAISENAYLLLSSPSLSAETCIPIDSFRPSKNSIPFDVRAESLGFSLQVPQWNTQAAFLSSKELGHVEGLVIDGAYHYNATTSSQNTDTLLLNVRGQSPYAYLHGFVVRYLMLLKDNYFGEFVHFRTLDEYQEQLQLKQRNPDAVAASAPPHKKSNDMDVILSVRVDDTRILLPGNLYSSDRYVQGEVASISVDLRFTNYYMDMEIDVSPISFSLGSTGGALESPGLSSSNTQLFIDGLRIFGHRLFGLPPTEPTYLCNWDVSVGAVSGECTTDFLVALMQGGKAFGFSFDDVENALVPYSSIIMYDVTFARINVRSVQLWLHVDEAAFLLSTGSIDVGFNDWARSHYSRRANIRVPDIQVSCVNAETAARQESKYQHPVETEAYLKTAVHLAIIGRKFQFSEERRLQQELVRREDQRTHRTEFLLLPEYLGEFFPEQIDPPAQCAPMPPQPAVAVGQADHEASSVSTSHRSRVLIHKSSFLSLGGSSNSSVLRPESRRKSLPKSRDLDYLGNEIPSPSVRKSPQRRKGLVASAGHLSVQGDAVQEDQTHSSVAFSSQYVSPHFPLQGLRPDTQDAPIHNVEDEEEEDAFFQRVENDLEDIDPEGLSEEHAYSGLLVEFPSGITAFANPTSIKYATSLLDAIHPSEPEDLLDSFQTDAMTEIFDLQKQRGAHGQIKDILLRIPKANFRLLNSTLLESSDCAREEHDQYDLMISKVALVTRTTINWDDPFNAGSWDTKTSVHLRLGLAEVSASERLSPLQEPQAALMAQIENVTVAVGAKEVRYFDADIGSINGSTSSGKIEYLASLIHRTGSVAADLGKLLAETLSRNQDRNRYFTYRLLEEGHSTNDPSFLIRPSAVLRSAQGHLRTFDSWKLVMRLRQIWTNLDYSTRSRLMHETWDNTPVVPPDAAQVVVAGFQRWRSWDLEHLADSVLLKIIFGEIQDSTTVSEVPIPLMGACRLGEMQFVLDPGPKQNKIGFADVAARIDETGLNIADMSTDTAENREHVTVLNVCCADAAVNLNWELCELADDILRLYNKNRRHSAQHAASADPPKKPTTRAWPDLHIVVEVTRGSIEVETINLNAKMLSDGLTASLLLQGGASRSSSMNFMLNCNAITSKLHSHSHVLGMSQLRQPSVFVSHELQDSEDAQSHTIKSMASSQSLTFAIKEDPIGLMEVLDLLFRDEIAQLYRIKSQLTTSPEPKPQRESRKMSDRLSSVRLNLAMFLDGYSISVPLLQSLTYKITGTVARAAAAANFGKEIIFDFDIKENFHETQINVRNEPRSISLLQIPPTNGRITSHMRPHEHLITVLSSLEVVQLDASAVYSLLSALNKPQISSALSELQQQAKLIQGHMADIFGSEGQETPKESIRQPSPSGLKLVYNVHMTLAGLQVSAKTSLKSDTEPIARVLFAIDRAHLQASNRHEAHGPILKYPELHLNVGHIGLDIRRGKEDSMRSCGSLGIGITVSASSTLSKDGKEDWSFNFRSDDFEAILAPETISTVIDVMGYMGEKIKDLDTSRELDYLRKLRQSKPRITINDSEELPEDTDFIDSILASVKWQFELRNIRVCWIVANSLSNRYASKEDLILSVKLFEFGTKTKRSARLAIQDFQVQMVPPGQDKNQRSLHSALLPEVAFNIAYISTSNARRMAFQAVGQSLDLRLTSGFIIPAAHLVESISLSTKNVQQASTQWNTGVAPPKKPDEPQKPAAQHSIFGSKRLESLLIDADFAGAVVYICSKKNTEDTYMGRPSLAGKYGQFHTDDSGSGTSLKSPGLACKIEYRDNATDDPSLYGEIKVDASSNILYPSVVPLVMDLMSSVKEVVKHDDEVEPSKGSESPKPRSEKSGDEDNILTADPNAILGRLKLNLGLRICRQEFSLSCQPIARVAATSCFDSIYFTINTVRSLEQGNFFAVSGRFTKLHTSVQHVYSRESTASFEIDSITLSLMNSKHFSGTPGVSAILNVSPMAAMINAKQAQDFLLFREIWYPSGLRQEPLVPVAKLQTETSQGHLVQRYQQVAATAAFPWTATISIAALDVNMDLGQAIGKSSFAIKNFWVSSKKTSDWEQNLCLGFDKIGADCTGRLSGFVALQDFSLRTSIQWPKREEALNETPLVQASLGFNAFRIKAAFDYQAFLVADITSLKFLMYNVRESTDGSGDRLVAIFDGDSVQIFGTTTSAAQGIALWQAIEKLAQERKENFRTSLREIEKFTKRRSVTRGSVSQAPPTPKLPVDDTMTKSPISLDTDVVVTLKALNLGVFPSTFSDHQVFKMEALNAYARFAASMEQRRIHSILRMTLGQLRIGLAGVRNVEAPKTLSEISVEDVVQRATGSRGGTILKVPQVSAVMETWQKPRTNHIDYIFKSAFEGKVEVGWNYSRVSYIRGMFANHSKSLEQVWGKELPLTAVKITGVPETEAERRDGEQQKITAEVKVPQSKYEYVALEPPIIETPQLRDMGEATPPLEWIGLHRDRLPNLTHQIVIVSLLELAGEVEDAYSSILGST